MISRTDIMAVVGYNAIYKEDGVVKEETHEAKIPKCTTREKAEIVIEKENRGKLIEVLSIHFVETKRTMEDEVFNASATVVYEKVLSEEDMWARNNK